MKTPRSRQRKLRPATAVEAADLQGQLQVLTERANAGDAVALAGLDIFLDQHPELWHQVGNLGNLTIRAWITAISGKNCLLYLSLLREVESWLRDLLGEDPTPTEKVVGDTAAVAWLGLRRLELQLSKTSDETRVGEAIHARLETATRRLSVTLKMLSQVRSEALPTAPAATIAGPRLYKPPRTRRAA